MGRRRDNEKVPLIELQEALRNDQKIRKIEIKTFLTVKIGIYHPYVRRTNFPFYFLKG